jgi:hypothetical protein
MLNLLRSVKQFINAMSDLFIVAGAPGSGKSHVCEQLTNVNYVSHDHTPRKAVPAKIAEGVAGSRPVVYDPTVKVSTTLKVFPQGRLVVIDEPEDVIRRRLTARGGAFTDSVGRRIKRMKSLSRRAEFTGTSEQVLAYLKRVTVLSA